MRTRRINHNFWQGVLVHDGGKGAFENNDLTGNSGGAWDIGEDCEPNVTRARNEE